MKQWQGEGRIIGSNKEVMFEFFFYYCGVTHLFGATQAKLSLLEINIRRLVLEKW